MIRVTIIIAVMFLTLGLIVGRYAKNSDSQQTIDELVKIIKIANTGCK